MKFNQNIVALIVVGVEVLALLKKVVMMVLQ